MEPLKVLFVQHDANLSGGVGRVLLSLIEGLAASNVTAVVALPEEGTLGAALDEMGIKRMLVPSEVFPGNSVRGAYRYLSGLQDRSRQLRELIHAESIDLVHTNTIFVFEGAIAALETGRPHVWHIHNDIRLDERPALFSVLPIADVSLPAVYRHLSDYVVGVSSHAAASFRAEDDRCRVETIYNGIDVARFDEQARATRFRIRDALGIPASAPLVGSVGRITKQKNFLLLAEVAKRTLASRPDTHFVLVGPESDRKCSEALRARISDYSLGARFHLLGERADAAALQEQFDVFVQTSILEGLPTVCLEAMCARRPIVATCAGGTDELVEHQRTGFVTELGDAEALASYVVRLVNDSALCAELGDAGRRRVEEVFTARRSAERFVELYHSATSAHGHARREERLLHAHTVVALASADMALYRSMEAMGRDMAAVQRFQERLELSWPYKVTKNLLRRFR